MAKIVFMISWRNGYIRIELAMKTLLKTISPDRITYAMSMRLQQCIQCKPYLKSSIPQLCPTTELFISYNSSFRTYSWCSFICFHFFPEGHVYFLLMCKGICKWLASADHTCAAAVRETSDRSWFTSKQSVFAAPSIDRSWLHSSTTIYCFLDAVHYWSKDCWSTLRNLKDVRGSSLGTARVFIVGSRIWTLEFIVRVGAKSKVAGL